MRYVKKRTKTICCYKTLFCKRQSFCNNVVFVTRVSAKLRFAKLSALQKRSFCNAKRTITPTAKLISLINNKYLFSIKIVLVVILKKDVNYLLIN